MFQVNNKGIKTTSMTSFWCLYFELWIYFSHFLVFLLLNLNKQMFFFYTNIYILSGKNYNHQVYTYKCCDITGNKKREILNVCWEICKNCALPRKNNCWTLHIGWISVATVHVFRYRKLIPECSLNRRVFPNVSNYWRKPLITFIAKLFGYAKNQKSLESNS